MSLITLVSPHVSSLNNCWTAVCNPPKSASLVDYKIWSFNGKPAYIACYVNRHDKFFSEKGLFDTEWHPHPEFQKLTRHKKVQTSISQPPCLAEMLQVAAKLSEGHPQVRVDLYAVDGHVYFGEMTFTASGCYMDSLTQPFLDKLGELTVLPIDI